MKNKTLLLLTLNVLSIGAAVGFSLSSLPEKTMFSIISSGMTLVFLLGLTSTWLSFISRILSVTSASLGLQRNKKSFSLRNMDELSRQSDLILKKFKLSADFIAKLTDTSADFSIDESLRKDKFGEALLNVRAELLKWKENESNRNWIAQGIAKFTEILRNKSELTAYSQQIISNLIKYLEASQGILFIENEEEQEDGTRIKYLQPVAGYAVGKSHPEKRVYEGQGMLGQCMIEKKILHIQNVPDDYIRINSGLGEAVPKHIVIVPLLVNEKFYGAIEVASFEEIDQHKIEFLREISENIASEIAAIKNHQQTEKLLEESNLLTRELQQHEDEMRHNMEELSRTQQEMMYKQQELSEIHKAIDSTVATAEFDLSGKLTNANEIFLTVLGYKREEVKGAECQHLMNDVSAATMMWENLRLGKSFSGEFKMKSKAGKELWLTGTFNPISISDKGPEKVMMFAQFTSQEKEKINDLSVIVNAVKSSLPVVEFDAGFACKSANEKFMKMFGVSRMDLRNKKVCNFIEPSYAEAFENIKSEILAKDFLQLMLPLVTKTGVITAEGTLTIARNSEGVITRVILILVKEINEKVPLLKVVE